MSLVVAGYYLTNDNRAFRAPTFPTPFVILGDTRSQGVEMTLVGNVTQNPDVLAI